MDDEAMRPAALRLRPRSDHIQPPSDASSSRRPSAPAVQTSLASTAPVSAAARVKARRKSRPSIQTGCTNNFSTHLTPPVTPNSPSGSTDAPFAQQSLFHNYLRAMHSFDPSATSMPGDDASQAATAIRPGDLILVHCIHANGWADGTVLNTGLRGWLPTNYCEAYDHQYVRNLLNAMTQFWDLLGASEDASLSTFVRQDYIRGLIAGVRYLLERADCLHRDAPTVKQYAGVRRMRKGLLADLSSLVQIAKRLQETIGEPFAGEVIHVLLDDLIARAFKVVTRAVSFTDVWTQETSAGRHDLDCAFGEPGLSTPADDAARLAVDTKGLAQPGTTPIDSAKHFPEPGETACSDDALPRAAHAEQNDDREKNEHCPRRSVVFAPPNGFAAHRVSMITSETPLTASGPMASEQLAKVHDICISHIGAFIGHHLHSRPSSELVDTTERLVNACRSMLAIIHEVQTHDVLNSMPYLQQAKHEFEMKVDELAKSTQDVFRFSDSPDEDVIMMPDQTTHLINVGTSLIRNTGECVVKTRQLIEHIGDFELQTSNLSLSRSNSETPNRDDSRTPQNEPREERNTLQKRISLGPRLSRTMTLPPPPIPMEDPDAEQAAEAVDNLDTDTFESTSQNTAIASSINRRPIPPPPPPRRRSMARTSLMSGGLVESLKSPKSSRADSISPARKDSVGMSIAGSTDTCHSSTRDSSLTAVSQVSTRATTPEHVKDSAISEPGLVNSFASISSIRSFAGTEDSIDAEAQLLQKTYANELTFNKDGQVTGGSIPALVEQLTTHDSAPDPQFVTAFFLTFRKFCEPREFAQALIDRFDYIGDSKTVGTPARLRIYNVFKGWLETYWNPDADKEALGEIRFFALHKLKQVLPTACERLIELTRRVTEAYSNGTITAPLVSGVGKISMSIGSQSLSALDVPDSTITVKQLNALRVATGGGSACTILDFDATEIARQLTLVIMRAYCEVRPDELLSMDWGNPNTKKAKNVRNMCLLNTDLAHVVGDTILAPDDAKKRACVIKQWVKVATACLDLCNYDSVMAIMCSLNSSVVQRLKKTWDLVSKKTRTRLEELEKVVDMSKNYSSLRRRLEAPTAPCLPFLGVYLTDLTFVIAGNPKKRELPGMTTETGDVLTVVNFDMYMRIAKIISHLQKFQVPYKLKPVPEMQTWLDQHLKRMRENQADLITTFHRRSLTVEPKQEERKHSSALSAFHRADNNAERQRTSTVRQDVSPIDRFDFFHRSTSLLSMRSHSTLAPSPEPTEPSSAH